MPWSTRARLNENTLSMTGWPAGMRHPAACASAEYDFEELINAEHRRETRFTEQDAELLTRSPCPIAIAVETRSSGRESPVPQEQGRSASVI